MEIRSHRVTLRPISMDDLSDCIRWASDPEVMHHIVHRTFTPEEETEWLRGVLKEDKQKVFIIQNEEGRSIGTCGIHLEATDPQLRSEEGLSLGIMIGEKSEWGKGYGAEVMRLLADMAHELYSANRIWLTVDSVHERGIRAYEKAGFTKVREVSVPDRAHTNGTQFLMERRYESAAA